MADGIYGWTGKILKINLSGPEILEINTMDYADRFLGGRGIATKIFWDEVGPGVAAFDPENYLIFMTGPLTATGAQGASRYIVAGKSPMTLPESFCYGNLGGFFGPYLKKAGYDGVAITGCAEKPCYIFIEDGMVEVRDASDLWGLGSFEIERVLKEKCGQATRFVTTGPAGENRVRTATLNTDNEGAATGGFGAVMGSKNLKAVAVLGSGNPRVARPEELSDLIRESIRLNEQGQVVMGMGDDIEILGKASCYQCGMKCMRTRYRAPSGKEAVRKCQAMGMYAGWVNRRSDEPAETKMEATGICNDLSLCTMEMANMLRWLYVATRAGDLTEAETGLNISEIGTRAFFEELASMIASRKGFGDVLAEGLLRVGDNLGDRARNHFTSTIGGVGGGSGYSPREYIINTMLYALEPRQPIAMLHEISRLIRYWLAYRADSKSHFVSGDVFRGAALRFWGNDQAWDMTTAAGKAEASIRIFDRSFVKDSLVLCDSSWPIMVSKNTPDHLGDPTIESRLFSAVTEKETDEAGLRLYGERIFNLQRAILLRDGWRSKEDDTPGDYAFTEPIMADWMNTNLVVPGPGDEEASVKGRVLDRADFEQIRSEFYELRGWDVKTGLQKKETLEMLDMVDVAEDLKGFGLLK
jgi:aldehyde:ferredoxin oxidoreductase